MSRFVNLELDGQAGEQPRGQPQAIAKDEAHYLHQAQEALEGGDFQNALRFYAKVLEFNPQNAAAWTAQVRMLIELDQNDDAKVWADNALERFPREADLLAAKAVVLARTGDTQTALAFSDAAVGENGQSPYVWLGRGDVLLARREGLADYCFDKALMLAPGDWLLAWLAARVRLYHRQSAQALRLLRHAVEWNPAHFLPWLELGRCQETLGLTDAAEKSLAGAPTELAKPRGRPGVGAPVRARDRRPVARFVAALEEMSVSHIDRLMSAVTESEASDLHLIAGVPPAFRVNGEIILADSDVLTVDEIAAIADGMLNEQQRKKLDQEWELCISLHHHDTGRVRVTFTGATATRR